MRIEPIEEKQMSWMLKPLVWMMKRKIGKVRQSISRRGRIGPDITSHDVDLHAVDRGSKVTPPTLKRMVCLRAAQMVGCVF